MRTCATIAALLLLAGCDESSDDPETTAAATDGSGQGSDGTNDTAGASTSSGGSAGSATSTSSTSTTGSDPSAGSTTTADDSAGATGNDSASTGASVDTDDPGETFHPEFVWLADFVREKCVACHNMGQNGNLVLPSVDMTNDEVRLALDGGEATTGRKFIEPFDPAQSQVYIMITNEAGEQFPPETINRVADWINLGAPYFAE